MNKYLENIVARTLGSAPVVEPRLASVFEPFAGGDGLRSSFSDESGALPEENRSRGTEPPVETDHGRDSPRRPPTDSTHEPTSPSASERSSRPVIHSQGDLLTIDNSAVPALAVIRSEAKENREQDSDPRLRSERYDKLDGLQGVTAPMMHERLPVSGIVVKSDAVRFHGVRDQDAAVAGIPSAGKPLEPRVFEDQKPTIRITIGRVDVRAIMTAQPVSRPVRTEPKAFVTLNEYLKRRDGGGR
jgi:hypothetical protein